MSCYGNLTYPETYLHFWNRKLRLSTSLASNLPWELAEPAFWNTPLLYCSKTKPGDLIEILRGNFNSWAVYVGNGYVVHFGAPNSSLASRIEGVDGIVKKEKLQYVAGEYSWKVNNTLDGKYRPIPPNEIVKKACSLVGASLKYHLTEFNSEHFATEMRYGKAESRQVAPHHDAPTSKLDCWYGVLGVMCGAIFPPNMLCLMTIEEFNLGLI
uniref:LRAT domain-containing protein n=1 Tax=Oryzias sinensis TaxID=183150 RepID=A0A8C7XT02_9TELE